MKNTITASITFSFKGKSFSPSTTLDLDTYLEKSTTLPNFYPLIARENNFDLYSYEYEMMQAESIYYSNARGQVAEFVAEGKLDINAFVVAWQENKILSKLSDIAKEHMNINDFQQHTELKKAMFAAYLAGKNNIK
ncbi:MAG: hypothetical protein GXP13_04945 [Gammaproteobacteria bacterium]|nr:hypothetical protein [Gammaproteobacteria bacterium]